MDLFCLTQKRPVTQEIEGKYGSAPPLPGQCLRASKKALYTLEINAMSRWDAQTLVFNKLRYYCEHQQQAQWQCVCLALFWAVSPLASHTWCYLARLAAPPGFQFPRGPVPTLCEAVVIYKIQPNTHKMKLKQFGVDMLDDAKSSESQIFGMIFKHPLWKFTCKKSSFFFIKGFEVPSTTSTIATS